MSQSLDKESHALDQAVNLKRIQVNSIQPEMKSPKIEMNQIN